MLHTLLITSCNRELGSGHFWRMTTLLALLIDQGVNVRLYSDHFPKHFPATLRPFCITTIPSKVHTIIRDKRDSSEDEATALKKRSTQIIALDDSGFTKLYTKNITLLPVPKLFEPTLPLQHTAFPFLFGYHFYEETKLYKKKQHKDIDLLIYTGFKQSDYPLNIDALAERFTVATCNGNGASLVGSHESLSYVDLLLRSKNFLSHFGLSLYEAALSNATVFALNPTHYHETLCLCEKRIIITNLGTFDPGSHTKRDEGDIITHLERNRKRKNGFHSSIQKNIAECHNALLALLY